MRQLHLNATNEPSRVSPADGRESLRRQAKFRRLQLKRASAPLRGRLWSDLIAWSPDSRCMALVEVSDSRCHVVVFDFLKRVEVLAFAIQSGRVTELRWSSASVLKIAGLSPEHDPLGATWRIPKGERVSVRAWLRRYSGTWKQQTFLAALHRSRVSRGANLLREESPTADRLGAL